MTLFDKLFEIATAGHNILPESWKEELRPYITRSSGILRKKSY